MTVKFGTGVGWITPCNLTVGPNVPSGIDHQVLWHSFYKQNYKGLVCKIDTNLPSTKIEIYK